MSFVNYLWWLLPLRIFFKFQYFNTDYQLDINYARKTRKMLSELVKIVSYCTSIEYRNYKNIVTKPLQVTNN